MRRFLFVALCAFAIALAIGVPVLAQDPPPPAPVYTIHGPYTELPTFPLPDNPADTLPIKTGDGDNPPPVIYYVIEVTPDQEKFPTVTVNRIAPTHPSGGSPTADTNGDPVNVTADYFPDPPGDPPTAQFWLVKFKGGVNDMKGDGYVYITVSADGIENVNSLMFRLDGTRPDCELKAVTSLNQIRPDGPSPFFGGLPNPAMCVQTFTVKFKDESPTIRGVQPDPPVDPPVLFSDICVIVNGIRYNPFRQVDSSPPHNGANAQVLYAQFPSGLWSASCADGSGVVVTNTDGGLGKEYDLTVYPMADGPITVRVVPESGEDWDVLDDVGWSSNSSGEVTVEYTDAPRVHVARQGSEFSHSPTLNFLCEFSKPVTDFGAGDVWVAPVSDPTNAGGTKTIVVTGSGQPLSGGSVYNIAVSGMTYSGNVIVSIDGNKAGWREDPLFPPTMLGNWPSAGQSDTDNYVVYDGTPPSAMTITLPAGLPQPPDFYEGTYTTDQMKIDIAGTATDDNQSDLRIYWTNDRWPEYLPDGSIGLNHGNEIADEFARLVSQWYGEDPPDSRFTVDASTGSWSKDAIYLRPGRNLITIAAHDPSGSALSYKLTVNCTGNYWSDNVDARTLEDDAYFRTPTDVGKYSSIAVNSSGNPGISYYDGPNGDLKYASWDGQTWSLQTVDGDTASNEPGDSGKYTSLKLDSLGNPHISYYDVTNGDLKYAYWRVGTWHYVTVDGYHSATDDVGHYSSLALDPTSGAPRIAYYDVANKDLRYAKLPEGKDPLISSNWNLSTVDSGGDVGRHASLALDASGNPSIAYYDMTNGDLKQAKLNGISWDRTTVDSGGDVGQYASLALNAGNARIAYYDVTNADLKYAAFDGTAWVTGAVDADGDVGQYASLALSSGDPCIAYYDVTNADVKYVRGAGGVSPVWETPSTVDDGAAEHVTNVRMVGEYCSLALDGDVAHISYYENWTAVNPGDFDYRAVNGYMPGLKYVFAQTGPTCVVSHVKDAANDTAVDGLTRVSPLVFDITFSSDVTGFTKDDIQIDQGTAGVLTTIDAAHYRLTVNPSVEEGDISVTVPSGVARATSGDVENAAGNTATIYYDGVRPMVTVDQDYIQPDPTNDTSIHFAVVFSEPVDGFTAQDLSISGSAGGTKNVSIVGGGTHYYVTVRGMTTAGSVIANLPAAVAVDSAGNLNLASTSTDTTVWFDATPPTVTINQASGLYNGPTQNDPTSSSTINFTAVFSEPVVQFANVIVTGSTADMFKKDAASTLNVVITPIGSPDAFGHYRTYNVGVSGMQKAGTVQITIPRLAVPWFDLGASYSVWGAWDCDSNGTTINAVQNSTSTDNKVSYDATPVTCTIGVKQGQISPTKDLPVRFSVVFSKAVTGFEPRDVVLSGTANLTGATKVITGSGAQYTVEVAGITLPSGVTSKKTVIANIPAGGVSDDYGNLNSAATTAVGNLYGNTVEFDNVGPTVTADQDEGQSDSTPDLPINFTATFSEPVTDFAAEDVTVTGTAVDGLVPTVAVTDTSGTNTVFNIAVGGLDSAQPGSVLVRLAAGVAHDALVNSNSASTATDNSVVYFAEQYSADSKTITDNDSTGIESLLDLSQYSGTILDANCTVSITHPYDQDLSGWLIAPDGTTVDLFANVGGNGANFTGTVFDDSAQMSIQDANARPPFAGTFKPKGLLSAFIGENITGIWKLKLVDNHGGKVGTINGWSLNVVIADVKAPTCVVTPPASQTAIPVNFTITFPEPVIGLELDDITVSGGTADSLTPHGLTYTLAVTPDGDGVVECVVAAQSVHDTCGNFNAASARGSLLFRGTPPSVAIDQKTSQSDPTNATPIEFSVVFSKPVTGFTGSDVLIEGTAGGTKTAVVTGSSMNYNVAVSGMDSSGTVIASIPAAVCTDLSGNLNVASTSTDNVVTFDVTGPTVTVEQEATQVDPTTSTPINFTVLFSKPVTDFTSADVTIGGSAGGAKTATVTGAGATYNVAVDGVTVSGMVQVTIAAGVAHDALGNANMASTSVDNVVWFDDGNPPQVTVEQGDDQTDPSNSIPINFKAVFNKAVTGFGDSGVFISGTAGALGGEVTEIESAAGVKDGSTYNIAVSDMAGSGTVICTVIAGAAQDGSGRSNDESTSVDNEVTFDIDAPIVSINQATDQADPAAGDVVNFTAVFNEPVTDFTEAGVVIGGDAGATTAVVTGSGTTYNVAVSGMAGAGTLTVDILAGAARDAAGNYSLASTSTDNVVTYMLPPSVFVEIDLGQPNPTSQSPVRFTVAFTKDVIGFATGDVAIGGTAGATTAVVTGSGANYDVEVSGMLQSGDITITIPAGVAEDLAGNPNLASAESSAVIYDTTRPGVTIDQADSQIDPTNASPMHFTVVFTKDVVDFTADDITLSGTAGASEAHITGSGTTYDVAVSNMTSSGTVIATIAANKVHDALGNGNFASTSTDNSITYDVAGPTVTINQAAGQEDPTSNSPINFTVIFSKSVADFMTGDVTLSGGAGATTATVTGSGTAYNVAVSGMTGSGLVTVTIAAGVAHDSLGNANLASSSTDNKVVFGASPLTCTLNQAAGQSDPTKVATISFTAVFSDPVDDFTNSDVTISGTAGGTKTVAVTGSGTTYNVTVTGLTATGTVIASIPAGVAHDENGISNAASTYTDRTVTYDITAPTLTITKPTAAASCTWNTMNFRCGGTASDTVGLGSITWTTGGGDSGAATGTNVWSATGIDIAGGHDVVTVTATDAAGNSTTDTVGVDVIPAVPGDLWGSLTMIGLPIIPYDSDPKLEVGFNSDYWVLYDTASGAYVKYPSNLTWFSDAGATPGRGFWASFASAPAVPYGMVPDQTQPVTIQLEPGWNLVGQPFISTVTWDRTAIMVNDGNQTRTLADARALGWLKDYAWGWEPDTASSAGGAYYLVADPSVISGATSDMVPWRSYWIKADVECDLILPAP